MRISGRSSDVCSSDLPLRLVGPALELARKSGVPEQILGAVLDEVAAVGQRLLLPYIEERVRILVEVRYMDLAAIQPPERPIRRVQIGRAWCRERVCRYVWHSGVPGSLNKKKKK